MLSLTNEELKSNQDAKLCGICGKRILKNFSKSINYWKVRDNYGYHFILKEFIKNVFLVENTKKYKHFPIPIEIEVVQIDKDGNESIVTIFYKIKSIDSVRFLEASLSNLVDNFTEGIHKIKCKYCVLFIEYESVKVNSIRYKWLFCNKDYSNKIDEELKKQFKNTLKFSKKRCLSLWLHGWLRKVGWNDIT